MTAITPPGGGAMECDGPDQLQPQPVRRWLNTATAEGLHRLEDSILLELAADVIDGWAPPRVDLLVEALRDRAAQYAAVEHFVPKVFLGNPAGLQQVWGPDDFEQTLRDAQLHPSFRDAQPHPACFTVPPRFVPPPFAPPTAGPARSRTNEPAPAGSRPRRAQQITRALLAAAVLALVLAVVLLWVGAR